MQSRHLHILPPTLLLGTLILSSCARTPAAPPRPEDLSDYLQIAARNGFSGAVLIARNDEVIFADGYGFADRVSGTPNTAETVFDSGSLSKQFTAAAIVKLREQALLRVTDPLTTFFENVPPDKADITLHQLLTHSSGLPEYVYDRDFSKISRDEAVRRALVAPLEFEPGANYLYSDTGYGMLAAIVEVVSGQRFQDFLHERLFQPAGMESTGFYNEPRWAGSTVAHGYRNGEDFGSAATRPGPSWGLLGFGGVLTTVGDLYRWHVALKRNRVLSAESVERLFTPYVDEEGDGKSFYGYGWVITNRRGEGKAIWHDGATDSHNAVFLDYVDHRTLVIALSNRIDGAIDDETFYGIDTGFFVGRAVLSNDFSQFPDYVR